MDSDLSKKIYKFGDTFYSAEELYNIYNSINSERVKKFKDCIAHFILAQIFRKAGLIKDADIIESIALLEKRNLDGKSPNFLRKKEYTLRIMQLYGLNGMVNKYKINEFINGEWLLTKLVNLTLGYICQPIGQGSFPLIDYDDLTESECREIAENFKRNVRNEEIVFFHSSKRLNK